MPAERDRREHRLQQLLESLDDVVGQDPQDQVAPLLELQVLATVAAIGFGILEMVIAIDLDDHLEGAGEEVNLDRASGAEMEVERGVELEQPGRLG